jgi:hypothetical protein
MTNDPSSHQKELNITIDATNPNCLQGLEQLLQLGLISDQQVREICETNLCCFLRESATVTSRENEELVEVTSLSLLTPQSIFSTATAPFRQFTVFFSEIGQGIKTELTVRWLLFLGVFLVVTSSGLLAANQWPKLGNFIQYTVLWIYTLGFWGVGVWTKKQQNSPLTSKSLRAIAWLLIPINFWAMDSLQLVHNWQEITLKFIACCSLIYAYFYYSKRYHQWLFFINILLLSFLNWGWQFSDVPLVTIYAGTLITVIILRGFRIPKTFTRHKLDLEKGFLIYCLFFLLLRGIFVEYIPISKVSLVIGILGWLLQSKQPLYSNTMTPILEVIGMILLFCGWLVGIQLEWPWQATIVSILGIHFFVKRLRRNWQRRDLFAIFIIGLQGLFLWDQLLPFVVHKEMLEWAANVSNTVKFSFAFYSIIFFPYVIIFAIFTRWIYRQNKVKVGQFGDYLIFAMTVGLSVIAIVNPLWRSLDLLLSTVTFIYLSRRPTPLKNLLINLTSLGCILGIYTLIYWRFPNLSFVYWSHILLILMCLLWIIANLPLEFLRLYRSSCRYLGFILGGCSYALLWPTLELFLNTGITQNAVLWWFITPLTLTVVAITNYRKYKRRRLAAFFSTYSVILAQTLTIGQPHIRLIGLGIGSVLMLVNSYFFRHPFAARIQVGFTLIFTIVFLWENFEGTWLQFLDSSDTFLDDGLLLVFLWFVSRWLQYFNNPLAVIYKKATNSWGILICLIILLRFSLVAFFILFNNQSEIVATWQHLIAPFLIISMIIFRYGNNLNYWAIYGITWALEISIIYLLLYFNNYILSIAIGNILFAILMLFTTSLLKSKYTQLSQLISFQLLPLYFAIFSILWRFNSFTAYTGLITIVAALIGIIVTYRVFEDKIYTYIFLGLITVGVHEWAIYKIIKGLETNLPNRFLLMGLVTVIIAIIYLLFSYFIGSKNRQKFFNLSLREVEKVAHTHWAIASILKTVGVAFAALTLSITDTSPYLNPINVAVSLMLSFYAFIQGRSSPQNIVNNQQSNLKNIWVFLGFVDIASTFIFCRLIWRQLSIFDSYYAGIFGVIALIIYRIPWINLGWNAKPWQQISLLLPSLLALITTTNISYESLFLVALFYGQVAINKKNLRWTYLSLGFIDWAIINFLDEIKLLNELTIALIIGYFILHIAQFDTSFKEGLNPKIRHYLRVLGSGIINIIALIYYQTIGLIPLIISLLTIGWGLGLKIKAFLYVGTITFIITVFYQLIVLSFEYAPLKWIIGLSLGISLIIIAAIFEKRRQKILSIWQNWTEDFHQWK